MINYTRLKQIRMDKKLSLQEMAVTLGLQTAGGYSRIESGENKLKAEQLPVLADKFQMSLDSFVQEIFHENKLDECSSVDPIPNTG